MPHGTSTICCAGPRSHPHCCPRFLFSAAGPAVCCSCRLISGPLLVADCCLGRRTASHSTTPSGFLGTQVPGHVHMVTGPPIACSGGLRIVYTARDNQNLHDVRSIARRPPPFSGISTGEKSWLWVVVRLPTIKLAFEYCRQQQKRQQR